MPAPPASWPARLAPDTVLAVAAMVKDEASVHSAMELAGDAVERGARGVGAGLDLPVAEVVQAALDGNPASGVGFMRRMGPLFLSWPKTAGVLMGHPDAGQWIAQCNREGVPLAAQVLRSARHGLGGYRAAALNNLAGLGVAAIPGNDEGLLAPWQEGVLGGFSPDNLPAAWRACSQAEVEDGMAALLNRAWPRGSWNKATRLPLGSLWNRMLDVDWKVRGQMATPDCGGSLPDLLTGYFLASPLRMVTQARRGRGGRRRSSTVRDSVDVAGFLQRLNPGRDGWLKASRLGPDDKGCVRHESTGWPLAGAVLLATLIYPSGKLDLGEPGNNKTALELVRLALEALDGAEDSELDCRLPLDGKPGPSLRGLAALCGHHQTAKAARGAGCAASGDAELDLREMLDAREALETFAEPQVRADMDRWLTEELLGGGGMAATPDAKTDACLQLFGYGLRVKAEGASLGGEMARALVRIWLSDRTGLQRRAQQCDRRLLRALARTPELLARYHMQGPDLVKGASEWPAFPNPGDDDGREFAWMPARLASMAAWERCVARHLGAAASDRTRWIEADVAVFRDALRRAPGWGGSDDAARWLAERLDRDGNATARGLTGAGVKALLPVLLVVLEARGEKPLPPGCSGKIGRWLDGCAEYGSATRAAIEVMQAWKAGGHPGHPGWLFTASGSGGVALRGACEKAIAAGGGQAALAAWLLGGWQAASLAQAHGAQRPRRRG